MAKRSEKWSREVTRMTRRLVALHAECTPAELAEGRAWYDRARAAAEGMAGAGGLERSAAVIAHLSPRQAWAVNVAQAARMLAAADAGEPCPAVHMARQRAKAWAVATGKADPGANHGPKTGAFYRNILGDADAVCVDRWAARAAGAPMSSHKGDTRSGLGTALYARVARAYVRAARALGMTPRDLQAVVWVHVRGAAD